MKPAYNKPSVIIEGVIRCSCHFNLGDLTFFLPDAVVNKSRQASSKEVKRSSSSVATQSVKRPKGKFHLKSYNATGWKFNAISKLSSLFLLLKNCCTKPAYNKLSVIFEGVIRCSFHFNLGDWTFLPDAVVNKSRQASSKEVKRSSSSVATKSVKHLKGKFYPKSYNAIG